MQVHNIPIRNITKKGEECICETVGEVHKSMGEVNEDGGNFIRVRVTLDINLPLCYGRVVTFESGDKRWVAFKYERLSNLCFWCGRLNHDDKSYEQWIQSKGTLQVSEQQFGPFLRASPYRAVGKGVIYVSGYYK